MLGDALGRHIPLLADAAEAALQAVAESPACRVAAVHTVILTGRGEAGAHGLMPAVAAPTHGT